MTGADGFIGNVLVESLLARGQKAFALLLEPRQGKWAGQLGCNLADESSALDLSIIPKIDCIVHLAGKAHALSEIGEGDEYFAINTRGTKKLLEAAQSAGVRRFVYFSSVKAMGEGGFEAENENSPCQPVGPYGQSKLEAEKLVLHGGYVPEPVVIRPTMVYGATDKGNLPRMIKMAARGLFPPLRDSGNRRSMVHVDDIVQAAILAAEKPEAIGRTYIVSDGQAYSTRMIYESIMRALGKKIPPFDVPDLMMNLLAKCGDMIGKIRGKRFVFDSDAFAKLRDSAYYDTSAIERELGFKPTRSLDNSIKEIVEFLK